MRIGLFGDLHGQQGMVFAAIEWIERTNPDFCLQAGDYWSYDVEWPCPVYWILGNHEDMGTAIQIMSGNYKFPKNSYCLQGGITEIRGVRVMSLPGLPQERLSPGPSHYPQIAYNTCMKESKKQVDIFLSHGCGFPFWGVIGNERRNFEEKDITELIRKVKPKYAVSGHNHIYANEEHKGITCIRLGMNPSDFVTMIEV